MGASILQPNCSPGKESYLEEREIRVQNN